MFGITIGTIAAKGAGVAFDGKVVQCCDAENVNCYQEQGEQSPGKYFFCPPEQENGKKSKKNKSNDMPSTNWACTPSENTNEQHKNQIQRLMRPSAPEVKEKRSDLHGSIHAILYHPLGNSNDSILSRFR
jgi:hypothetical protein